MQLVASLSVGRIAVAAPGEAPLVVPVTYVVDEGTVVFRTGATTEVARLLGNPVSFQVDVIDSLHRSGWSVLIRGTGGEINAGSASCPRR